MAEINKEKKMTEINIWWEGPLSQKKIDKLKKNNDRGLYQIYGTHHIYGSDVLLYIGRTTDQNFGVRLNSRDVITENQDSDNIKIYVGRIFSDIEKISNLSNRIKWAEAILIHSHAPAKNSSNIRSNRSYYDKQIHVFNYNNYRDLLPEVSSKRWYQEFKNIEIVDKIAKHYQCEIVNDDNDYGCHLIDNILWVGIDEEYWTINQAPLSFGISADEKDKELVDRFKKKYKLQKPYKYEDYTDFYHVPLNINLEHFEEIINELDEAIDVVKQSS